MSEVPAYLRIRSEKIQWPEGRHRPAGGWNPYDTPDLLCELGLARVAGGNLLLRAILSTDAEVAGHGLSVQRATTEAIAYEVVDVAPDVPPELGFEVGQEVIHLSAAADRVDPDNDYGRYYMVDHIDISLVWNKGTARRIAEVGKDCETLDELKAAVATLLEQEAVSVG